MRCCIDIIMLQLFHINTKGLQIKEVSQRARPFVKWAGGKSKIVPQILEFFPENFKGYYEPFLGGGALFFAIAPQKGCLNDKNGVLIETYINIRDHLDRLIDDLVKIENEYFSIRSIEKKADYYYKQRDKFNSLKKKSLHRSALFIFLNKTCYNGMYRENKLGQFNIPFGKRTQPVICDKKNLSLVSELIKGIGIKCGSYEESLKSAKPGDFIYLDPPYEPLNSTSRFTEYQAGGFIEEDQVKLARLYRELTSRGCLVMMSNSTAQLIYDLYSDFHINKITVRRGIQSNKSVRSKVEELIITNYNPIKGLYLSKCS